VTSGRQDIPPLRSDKVHHNPAEAPVRSLRTSRCPRTDCDGTQFEEKELKVRGEGLSQVPYLAVQCAKCGAVVAVNEWADVPGELRKLSKRLDEVARKLSVM
jgi:predicted nucleic-acid-binding Zn-ribbon protein